MLAKSKKSAFVMAVLYITTALIVAVAIVAVRYLTGTISLDAGENTLGDGSNDVIIAIVAILGIILLAGFGLVMLSLWIYGRDDSHFGSRGAIRWAMSGAACAILVHPASILLPRSNSVDSASIAALYQVLRLFWGFFAFGLSYRLVFKWFPLTRVQHTQQPDKSSADQTASIQPRVQNPSDITELLARIRHNPQIRLAYQAMSWFAIGGGIIILIVGLATPEHPNPYLLSFLIVMGFECLVIGAAVLLFLRQSGMTFWLMLSSCILFAISMYLLVRVFTHSP